MSIWRSMTLDRSIPRDSWPTEATDPLRDLEAGSRRAKRNGGEKGERRAGEKRTEPRGTNRGGRERRRRRKRERERKGIEEGGKEQVAQSLSLSSRRETVVPQGGWK